MEQTYKNTKNVEYQDFYSQETLLMLILQSMKKPTSGVAWSCSSDDSSVSAVAVSLVVVVQVTGGEGALSVSELLFSAPAGEAREGRTYCDGLSDGLCGKEMCEWKLRTLLDASDTTSRKVYP